MNSNDNNKKTTYEIGNKTVLRLAKGSGKLTEMDKINLSICQ